MDGETNGSQQEAQAQQEAQTDGQEGQQQETHGQQQVGGSSRSDYERQIEERDARIAELEAQVAEAAKNDETADQLRGEIAELKAQGESDRIDFKLQLAGVRNVKAARALLGDHGNSELCQYERGLQRPRLLAENVPEGTFSSARSVDKLKEAEPWLFEVTGKHAKGGNAGSGTTGLPNTGAASDEGKTLKHWREIAGLTDSDSGKTKN